MKEKITEFIESIEYIKCQLSFNSVTQDLGFDAKYIGESHGGSDLEHKLKKIYDLMSNRRIQKRQFDYSVILIYIYSCYERFVDGMIDEYVKNLNLILPKYSDLPENIRSNHLDLSLELMRYINRYEYLNITSSEIIENLYKIDCNSRNWQLNYKAFSIHNNNLRIETLKKLFSNVGIVDLEGEIKKSKIMKEYISSTGIKTSSKSLDFLKNLVDDRNTISHRWHLSQLVSESIMLELINDMLLLCKSLYEILSNRFYQILLEKGMFKKITDEVVETYQNGEILIASLHIREPIYLDQDLYYANYQQKKNCIRLEIISMQINNSDFLYYQAIENTDVGIKIRNRVYKGGCIYRYAGTKKLPDI